MIQSAVVRLTLSYLAIIMALSIGFSVILYHFSSSQLEHELRRPAFLSQINLAPSVDYDEFRIQRLKEGTTQLRTNLIIFNICTLILGGALSYFLARRTLRPIEEAMDAQTRFTAAASHELRTPLTAMQTEIEVALRNKQLSDTQSRQLLESNLEEVEKLRTLSEGLLRLARHDSTEQLRPERISFKDIIPPAIARIHKAAEARHIAITDETKPLNVYGDKQALSDVLAILLDNAVKYSDNKTTIFIRSNTSSKFNQLIVVDQGKGIAPKDLPHIFDRFYRADASRSKSTEGFGLGLSIAKHIIDMHGGSIHVSSQVNKGSTFTIRLPREE